MSRPIRVLLGVGGGIAAIKAAEIVRLLRGAGHEVQVALSPNAASFVAPLALEVLSGTPVRQEEYLTATGSGREEHIELGRWADVFCFAPATAHLLAGLALGLADSFLTTTALVFEGPVVVAPAMSSEMWAKPVVQEHMGVLAARGVVSVGPVRGPLATGEIGEGRMAEPQEIVAVIERQMQPRDLAGRTVLITAGPTREPIDPVRFLSNRSSGKMGFSLAAAAAARGAAVHLVTGPVDLPSPLGVRRIDVETAREMEARVRDLAADADLIIMTAAVADFRPAEIASSKLKKRHGAPELVLERNPDILAGLADLTENAVRVGFAAETRDLEDEAAHKLVDKRLDFIVANDVGRPDIGFGSDENEVVVMAPGRDPVRFAKQSKSDLAHRLLDQFAPALARRETDVVVDHR